MSQDDHDLDREHRHVEPKESLMGRAKTWGIVALVVLVAAILLSMFLPRWWADRVVSIVGNNPLVGALAGIVIGFVFTFVPLIVMVLAVRNRQRTGLSITLSIVALLLAVPNLATLWIVIGRGSGAQAGRRKFLESAPGFRAWTLVGVIIAVAAFGYLWYLVRSRAKAREEAKRD